MRLVTHMPNFEKGARTAAISSETTATSRSRSGKLARRPECDMRETVDEARKPGKPGYSAAGRARRWCAGAPHRQPVRPRLPRGLEDHPQLGRPWRGPALSHAGPTPPFSTG